MKLDVKSCSHRWWGWATCGGRRWLNGSQTSSTRWISRLPIAEQLASLSVMKTRKLALCSINRKLWLHTVQFSSVQSLSRVRLFVTLWIAARQASLSITNSRSSLRLASIESVMPSSHLILGCPLLLLPPIPPSIKVFSSESALRMRWPIELRIRAYGSWFWLWLWHTLAV